MNLIEKMKGSNFFAQMTISDAITKCLLLLLVAGVWAVFIEMKIEYKKGQDVYVVNTVEANVYNPVDVKVRNEVDVNGQHWTGWLVGSHFGYNDNQGVRHVAIDVHNNN